MFFGSRRAMKSVVAAEVAALSAWRLLQTGDRVGGLIFNDQDIVEIKPHRSETRVMQLLNAVVDMNHQLRVLDPDGRKASPPANGGMLNQVIRHARRVATHDFLVVLISDCYGADDASRQMVTNLCHHNDLISAFVYDPLEAEMPQAGKTVVSEGPLQLEINMSDARLRQRFQEQFVSRIQQIRQFSAHRSIPLLPISTTRPVAEQIRELLGQAGQRSRLPS